GDALHRIDDLQRLKATAVTTIQRHRGAAGARIGERITYAWQRDRRRECNPGCTCRPTLGSRCEEIEAVRARFRPPPWPSGRCGRRVSARDVEVKQDHMTRGFPISSGTPD